MASYSRVRLYTMLEVTEILGIPLPTLRYDLETIGIVGEMHDSPNAYGPRKIKMLRGTDIARLVEYRKAVHPRERV